MQQIEIRKEKPQNKSRQKYYSDRFQPFFKENFESEKTHFNSTLLEEYQTILANQDYEKIQFYIKPLIEKVSKIYGIQNKIKEQILLVTLNFLFEQQGINYILNNSVLDILKYCLTSSQCHQYKIKIDWKILYNFYENKFKQNDLKVPSPIGSKNASLFVYMGYIIIKLRKFFDDSSILEIFSLFKEKLNPLDLTTSISIIYFYLKFDIKAPKQYYIQILDELIIFWGWKTFQGYDNFFFNLMVNLQRIPNLLWEKHLDFLYTQFQKQILYLMPMESKQYQLSHLQWQPPSWYQQSSNKSCIAILMVGFMVPSNHQNYDLVWENTETIFRLLKNFMHPNNEGKHTVHILKFFNVFVQKYVERNVREKNIQKKLNQQNKKKEEEENEEEEEEEDVDQYNDYGQQQEQTSFPQTAEDEYEENQIFSDDDIPESYLQKNEENIKVNLLDQVCHERFLNICLQYLEYMIYLKEQKSFITLTIKYLVHFQPEKVIPFLIPKLYDTLTRSDMTYSTIIKIFMILITPLMNRKQYKQGLYEIPNIIRNTQQQLTANDLNLSYSIWKLYDRIFSYLPIQDPDDLIQAIKERRPDLDDDGVKSLMNEGEDIDMLRFYEDYSEISKIVLKQFLNLFQYIDQKKQIEKNYRTSFISVHNKYWSFVFQASPSIFKETIQYVSSILGNQIQIQAQKQYSYLLQSFSLRDPNLSLHTFFIILYNQLIKKSKESIETLEKNPMFYIIKAQENSQQILSYTLEDLNEKSLLWYLDLIEDLLTFSGIFSKQFDKEIQIIIFRCFLHPEFSIFSKATKILHKIILSLISIYPLEIRCWSQSEQPNDPLYPFNYHKYLGEENHEKFDISWHSPTQEERNYALVWFNRIWGPIMDHFDNNYFKDEKIIITDRFEGLIDQMMQEKECENINLKNEIQMSFYLLEQTLGAVHLRMTTIEDKENSIQKQFIENFKYKEYDHVNQQLMKFISNSFSFLIRNNLIQNVKISLNIINLINNLLSIDEYNNKLLQMVKWLKNTRNAYKDPYSKWSNTPRFINIIVATVTFYTRIYSQTYNIPYGEQYDETKNQIFFLIFHPYDKVQQAAELTLKQYCQSSNKREKLKQELLGYTFPIFENRLKKSSPNFFPKLMVQDKPNFSSLQVQFNRTISVLKLVLKLSFQFFYQSIQDISKIQELFEIIQSYDEIPNDITKKTLIQMIPMVFVIFLMSNKKLQQLNNQADQKLIINQENKIIEYKKIILYDYETTDQLIMQLEKFRQYCFDIVKDEQCNARKKTILSLSMLLCSLQDQDPEGETMKQNMEIFSSALLSNEYDIRNLGMYSIFSLLRIIKRSIKTTKVVECEGGAPNPELHFLKEDQLNNLKCGYFGFIQPLRSMDVSDYDFSKLSQFNLVLLNKITNKDFSQKFIEYLHNDINCAKENQKNQMSQMQQFMSNSNIFIYHYFNIDAKKDNLFKSHEISREFYIRYIKKLFQVVGYIFFQNTKDFVSKLINSEKKEDQNFIYIYLIGLFKSTFTKMNCNNDQLIEMQDYVFENTNREIQNISREQFQMWQVGLLGIFYSSNKNQMKNFLNYLLKQKFATNKDDAKYTRFLWIIRMYIRIYGYQDQEISNSMLQEFLDREPSENKQIQEYSRILLHIFIFTYNVPLKMDINLSQDLVQYDEIYVVQRSSKLKEVFTSIVNKAQVGDKESMKKYAEMINKIFEIFIFEKMDENLFWYLEDVFVYYLEFKEEDIEDPVIIKALSINVLQLASLQYHKQIINKKPLEQQLANQIQINRIFLGNLQILKQKHFIYSNKFMIDPSYDFLSPVIELLNDTQQLVLNLAQNALSDLLKITSPQQILKIINVLRDKIQSQSQEEKVKGLQGYMSLLLHQPYEAMDWTEECLNQLLSNKNLANNVKVKLKDFASKFLKNNYQDTIKKETNLSENILIKLKEIANPYNYFA